MPADPASLLDRLDATLAHATAALTLAHTLEAALQFAAAQAPELLWRPSIASFA
jgi:hypothetical protein